MASGFLVLADGRCLAVRWLLYDEVLRAVSDELNRSSEAEALREWLHTMLPKSGEEEDIGRGAWVRSADGVVVKRFLDVRGLTPRNQRLFHEAALRAGKRAATEGPREPLDLRHSALVHLLELVERAERGEPALSLSDWREVVPPEGRKLGPGW